MTMKHSQFVLILVMVFAAVSSWGFANNKPKEEIKKIEQSEEKVDQTLGADEGTKKQAIEEEEEPELQQPFEARTGFQQQPQIATTEERR